MTMQSIRLGRGLTTEQLAVLAGVHKSTISRAERGIHDLSPQTIVRLSRALKVSPSALSAKGQDS